jgi:PilZ domain
LTHRTGGFLSKENAVDKRESKRVIIRLGCWLVGSDEALGCGAYEISDTGVRVMCSNPPPPGRTVRLEFFTPFSAGAVTVQAEVIWSTLEPEGVMGLRFLGVDDGTRSVLKELMGFQQQQEQQ